MAESSHFQNTVDELIKGMDSFLSSKTVVGEPIHVGDTIILPLVDVTFGIGAGANEGDRKNTNSGGGVGGKMSPNAVLVISNGTIRLISVKDQGAITKLLDMVPDVINKFTGEKKDKPEDTPEEETK